MKIITPSAGTPTRFKDILGGIFGNKKQFEKKLLDFVENEKILLTNSGTTSIWIALEALKKLKPERNEIILQAYTAPSLILPIRKAGLKPVLADTSPKTFNIDFDTFEITEKTLAVMVVHMFGIPLEMDKLNQKIKDSGQDIFLIEDAASSMGTKIGKSQSGGICDVGVISFNRGKNYSTLNGGAIFTNNSEIYEICKSKVDQLKELTFKEKLIQKFRAVALALAVRPFFYTILLQLISRFKYTEIHLDFVSFEFTDFQGGLGSSQFEIADEIFEVRKKNGDFLINEFENCQEVIIPELPKDTFTCFNQFPLLLKNPKNREKIVSKILEETQLEVTTLYDRPIHKVSEYEEFRNFGSEDLFPNSTMFSEKILLIPTHPLVSREKLQNAVGIIKREAL